MDQVWNNVKGNYYIDSEMDIIERIDSDRIDNKDVNKNSTTAKFKKDICDIFNKPNLTWQQINITPPSNNYYNSTIYYLPKREF